MSWRPAGLLRPRASHLRALSEPSWRAERRKPPGAVITRRLTAFGSPIAVVRLAIAGQGSPLRSLAHRRLRYDPNPNLPRCHAGRRSWPTPTPPTPRNWKRTSEGCSRCQHVLDDLAVGSSGWSARCQSIGREARGRCGNDQDSASSARALARCPIGLANRARFLDARPTSLALSARSVATRCSKSSAAAHSGSC